MWRNRIIRQRKILNRKGSVVQENIIIIRSVILLAGLAVIAVEDLYRKEISTIWPVIMGIAGVLLSVAAGEWNERRFLLGFIPGILVLSAAWLTNETIGYGDGLVILCLGCFLTGREIMDLCVAAITLAGITALFLLVIMRKGRKTEIPFVPFLFAGCIIIKCIQGG